MCKKMKIKAYNLGQRRCMCGRQLNWVGNQTNSATVEHIIPQSQGGLNVQSNKLIVCRRCNEKRGNMSFVRWILMNDYPNSMYYINKYMEAIADHLVRSKNQYPGIRNADRKLFKTYCNQYDNQYVKRIKDMVLGYNQSRIQLKKNGQS